MDLLQTDICKAVEPIIRNAGDILLSYFHNYTTLTCREKEAHGFVTEADEASEEYLINELAKLSPDIAFFAEESGKRGEGDYCWVIDPLDGTTNFAHGLPYFCISVALTHKNIPVWGAVFQPLTNEFFYAQRGKGAFRNGAQMRVSRPEGLQKSLVVVGLPYAKNESFLQLLEKIRVIAPKTYAFRHLGAVALDQAYVASGRLDGLFFRDLAWWDVAAGMLLIQEAGGKVSDFAGKAIDPDYTSFVAAGQPIYQKLFALLQ